MSLGSMEFCGGVHTAQRQITTQISIEFCILVIGLGLCLGHCQSDYTIRIRQYFKRYHIRNILNVTPDYILHLQIANENVGVLPYNSPNVKTKILLCKPSSRS